ncbi:hypothetical protein ACK12G_09405 [Mycolicibacterium wolinskyi]|uniref:hypothetical protein n=1 Tax=Mycolicibacterium wolinskyi TaxID=59750 RepID=UPI0039177699
MSNPITTDTDPTDNPDAEAVSTEPDTAPTAPDAPDETEGDQDNGNKEAAKWRRKLRDTEAERDTLRDQITAQHRAIIDWRASTAQSGAVDPQLLDAAGIDITALLDDNGHLDMTAVDQFIDQTAVKFRVQRTVKPNPQQGNPSAARPTGGLAGMFQEDRLRTQ